MTGNDENETMIKQPSSQTVQDPSALLPAAFQSQMPVFRKALGFSVITGLLALAPSVFMLEVYDRVVNSRSAMTLMSLLLWVLFVYAVMEVLDKLRSRLLQQAAWRIDEMLRERLHDASYAASLRHGVPTTQAFHDLRTVREGIGSPVATAIMDLPTSVIFLFLVFIISPWLGGMSLVGAVVQVMIGVRTERKTLPALSEANKASIAAQSYASGALRNAQVISAMGMQRNIHERWITRQHTFLRLQAMSSDTAGSNASSSKFIQTMQSSLILGLSCWLTIKGMLLGGGGMMIVASTLGGRVLSPLVQLVGQWRTVVNMRDAYQRLDQFLSSSTDPRNPMPLPAPEGQLAVEGVVAAAPGSPVPVICGVSFALQPGEMLMLIGPSAAGKTALARVLMGVWPTHAGKVRLDGADLHAWNKEALGPHLGYLPQSVELLDGTLAENIARFGDVDMDKVHAAIALVGLDTMVDALPDGLLTRIGDDGAILSGGQRQRVGLARAIYGNPNFIVLDEPNASLDVAGEQALLATLKSLKQRNCTTIVITHRTSVLPMADKILVLRNGKVAAFGPRDDVLASLKQPGAQRPAEAAVTSAIRERA